MKVIYKPTGQLGEIPDDKYDPNLFAQVSDGEQSQTETKTSPQVEAPKVSNPFGASIDQLREAQAKALSAGDTKNATLFKNLLEIETAKRDESKEEEGGTPQQQFNVNQATRALDSLETAFGRGEKSNIGTGKDLSLNPNSTVAGDAKVMLQRQFQKVFDGNFQQDLKIYEAQRDQFVSALTQITGAGAPQAEEAKRLIASMPNPYSSDKEAKAWFDNARKLLGMNSENKKKEGSEEIAPQQEQSFNPEDEAQSPDQQELTRTQKTVKTISDVAPVIGGILGGVGGSVAGLPFLGGGALVGGAVGTTAGTGAGLAFGESLENLFGIQDETSEELLKESVIEPVVAGALDFATAGTFDLAGGILKYTGKGIANYGDDLALKTIRPSKSQQAKFFQKTGTELKDFVVKNGLFDDGVSKINDMIIPAQDAFDDIALNSGATIPTNSIVKRFDEIIKPLEDIPSTKAQKFAEALNKEKDLFLEKAGDNITARELTFWRRRLDRIIPKTAFTAEDPIVAGVNATAREIYQDTVIDATKGLTSVDGKDLFQLGQELQKMYEFERIVQYQQYLGKGSPPIDLLKQIGLLGGGGALVGGVPGGVTGLAISLGIPTLLNNPKVTGVLARKLPTIGKAIETVPDNQKAKIATEVFRRILTNIGALSIAQMGDAMQEQAEQTEETEDISFNPNDSALLNMLNIKA